MQADNAGVKFPPPFVYAAAVIGGWLLNRAWPLRIGSGRSLRLLAWLFVAVWAALFVSSFGSFLRRKTTIVPNRPAHALVIKGPYRFTRNPMYVSLVFLTIGVALVLNTWWAILLLVPGLVLIQKTVIAREEAYLRRRFGAEYDEYTRHVRRWI
jgi:protein-S-isoprenylcysteine O-methyltransferase Ste14